VRPLAVYDTNVLFSGIGGWKGLPFQCLEAVRAGKVDLFVCAELLSELREKLAAKLKFSPKETEIALVDLLKISKVVEISGNVKAVPADPDDDKIVECAVVASATHLVTGDKSHLLPMKNYQGIKIVTPRELIDIIGAKNE